MKKILITLFSLFVMSIGIQASKADCPCQTESGDACPCVTAEPCKCHTDYCEDWLCPQALEDYFCRLGLSECQKDEARNAVGEFKCKTQAIRDKSCKCESKCECRTYKKALIGLDCKMQTIITKCQKDDYKCVRKEIKDKVKCCHKCFINPFHRCKCSCS